MTFLSTLLLSIFLTIGLIPVLQAFASRMKMMDTPGARKVHSQPIPRVGGIAMAVGAFVPVALWNLSDPFVRAYLAGAVVMVAFGIVDDLRNLKPKWKLLGQLAAALVVVFYGGVTIHSLGALLPEGAVLPEWVCVPMTVLAIVGVTNAVNLSDGLDGLAGGICLLIFACIGYLAWQGEDVVIGLVALALAGSIFGFLRFNTHPATVFMGDTGSQLLGFSAVTLSLSLTQGDTPLSPMVPLVLLGLPVLDTLSVMAIRIANRRSPFSADMNHIHHNLMALGLQQGESVVTIYTLQMFLVASAFLFRFHSDWLLLGGYLVFSFATILFLTVANGARWNRRPVEPPRDYFGSRFLRRMKTEGTAIRKLFPVLEFGFPLLLIVTCLVPSRLPGYVSYSALAILRADPRRPVFLEGEGERPPAAHAVPCDPDRRLRGHDRTGRLDDGAPASDLQLGFRPAGPAGHLRFEAFQAQGGVQEHPAGLPDRGDRRAGPQPAGAGPAGAQPRAGGGQDHHPVFQLRGAARGDPHAVRPCHGGHPGGAGGGLPERVRVMGTILRRCGRMKSRYVVLALVIAVVLLPACGGPDEKKMKFYNRGKAYYDNTDYVKAGLEFKNAIQIDPKFDNSYYMLGMTQMMRGDFGGAYKSIGKATELNPKLLPAQIQMGKLLVGAGQGDKAMERAEIILREDPGNEDAQILQGAVFLAGKEYGKARAHLEGMLSRGVTKPDVYMLLAASYTRDKEYRSAEGVLVKGLKTHEKFLPMHRGLADVYMAAGRTEETASEVRKVIELEPENYGNRITLAGLYWDTGRQSQGREVLDALLAEKPADEGRRLDTAAFYGSRGSVQDAEAVLREGIRQNGKSYRMRFLLSDLYRDTGRTDNAVVVLKECLALDKDPAAPDILQAKVSLARVHASRQELDKAGGYVDEVIKESPRNVDAHLLKGNLYLLRQDGAGAVAEFRTVVDEKPRFMPGYLFLAEAHLLKNEKALAQETLQRALKVDPGSRDARRALAKVHAMKGEFPRAEEYLKKNLEEQPGNLQAMADLGDLYLAAKDWKRAEGAYLDIQRKAPQSALGYMRMGEFYSAQKKWDRAADEYEQAVKRDPGQDVLFASLVQLYAGQKKFGPAIAACEARVQRNPEGRLRLAPDGAAVRRQGDPPEGGGGVPEGDGRRPGQPGELPVAGAALRFREGLPQGRAGLREGGGETAGLLARGERPGRAIERPREVEGRSRPGARTGAGGAQAAPRGGCRPGHLGVGVLPEGRREAGAGISADGAEETSGEPRGQLPPRDGLRSGWKEAGCEGVPAEGAGGQGGVHREGGGRDNPCGDLTLQSRRLVREWRWIHMINQRIYSFPGGGRSG